YTQSISGRALIVANFILGEILRFIPSEEVLDSSPGSRQETLIFHVVIGINGEFRIICLIIILDFLLEIFDSLLDIDIFLVIVHDVVNRQSQLLNEIETHRSSRDLIDNRDNGTSTSGIHQCFKDTGNESHLPVDHIRIDLKDTSCIHSTTYSTIGTQNHIENTSSCGTTSNGSTSFG